MSHSRTIGVLHSYQMGPYFNNILAGIHALIEQHNCRLVVAQAVPRDVAVSQLASERINGWIVVLETEGIHELAATGVPLVMIDVLLPELRCPAVLPDNVGGMEAAVRHLIEHGHRRIAFVGYLEQGDIQQRFEGYKAALAAHDIPFDPALVIPADDNIESGGRAAAARLLAAHMPCSALAVATDRNTLGLLEVLQEAGYQLPQDLALVSFDDLDSAQFTNPPLTSVRQRFDALGRRAAELVLQQIAGAPVEPSLHRLPTALVRRNSCGCNTLLANGEPADSGAGLPEWRQALRQEIVRLATDPLSPTSTAAAEHLGPAAEVLIQGLEAAVLDQQPVQAIDLERAWLQLFMASIDLDLHYQVLRRLRQAGVQQLSALNARAAEHAGLSQFLDVACLAMVRAWYTRQEDRVLHFERRLNSNYQINRRLLSENYEQVALLSWISQMPVSAACLGLWPDEVPPGGVHQSALLTLAGVFQRAGASTLASGERCAPSAFPPVQLLPPAAPAGPAVMTVLVPVRTHKREWGFLSVAGLLDELTAHDWQGWAALLASLLEHGALLSSLREQHQTLRVAYEREQELLRTLQELSCPLIPLLPQVLLVPLVGAIDTDRAQRVLGVVLHGINMEHAHTVLLDITGVPLIDTQVASMLIQTARASALLGAQLVLVGVRPEIAQSIVGLGLDLTQITTCSTLAEAIMGLQSQRNGLRALSRLS